MAHNDDIDIERTSSRDSQAKSSPASTPASVHNAAAPPPLTQTPQYVGFWHKDVAPLRKQYFVNLARVTVAVTIIVWTCMALYWGSLYRQYPSTHKLKGWIVNRDPDGVVGQNVTDYILSTYNHASTPHITYSSVDPSLYDDATIANEVAVEQRPWAVLVIAEDATARLEAARAAGNASWVPSDVVTLVYSEARNQQTVPGLIVATTQAYLGPYLAQLSATLAAEYLPTIATNASAIRLAATAPQTLSGAVAMSTSNLRPYYQSSKYTGAILAVTYVGLIYLTILAFNIVMANFGLRQPLSARLTLPSLIGMRIVIPLVIYLWLSLHFSLLQIPFKLNYNGWGKGYGAGFMVFWMIAWSAMSSLGLIMDAVLSLVGVQFIGFGLVVVIITNVSGALLPPELAPGFYKYSYAFPFYNIKEAFLIIFVNAGKHIDLLKYVGIVWAWLAVVLLTFPIWIWRERRSAQKAAAAKSAGAGAGAAADAGTGAGGPPGAPSAGIATAGATPVPEADADADAAAEKQALAENERQRDDIDIERR